ncbi:MAG: hypothetical protein Q4E13_12645 [Clostridia bacterium]|nr:hypothetical protein [Clostridia bacterium]
MKATKKILSLVLTLLLVCSSFSTLAEMEADPAADELVENTLVVTSVEDELLAANATDPDGGDKDPDKVTEGSDNLNTNPDIPDVNTPTEPQKPDPDQEKVDPDAPVVEACDHSKLFEVKYDCTKPVEVHEVCPTCGQMVDVVLQPPAGHEKDPDKFMTVKVKEPTCAEAGYEIRQYTCKYCDYLFETEKIDLPKIDHDLWAIFTTGISDPYGKDKTGAYYFPTDENPETVWQHGEIKFWQSIGIKNQDRNPESDNYDKAHLTIKTLAPTCDTDGYVRVTCDVCDLKTPIFGDISNIRLLKLGHHWIAEDHHFDGLTSKPATCTEYGYEYQVCDHENVNTGTVCGEQRSVTLKPLGHDFENENCEKVVVQDGKVVALDEVKLCRPYVIRTYCIRKDAVSNDGTGFRYNCTEYKDSDIIVAQYPHNDRDYYPQGEVEFDELYNTPGINEHWKVRYVNAPECAHNPGEAMIQCMHCGEWWTIKLVESKADESYKVTKEVTCTTDGEKTWTCNVCGATRIEVMPAPGHVGRVTIQKPTCKKAGSKVETCINCGEVLSEVILPAAHQPTPDTVYAYKNVVWDKANNEFIAAYCDVDGSVSFNCAACGAKNVTMTIKAPGHDLEEVVVQEATCTKPEMSQLVCTHKIPEFKGFYMTGNFIDCTYAETPYQTAPANGHNMVYIDDDGVEHTECVSDIAGHFDCSGVLTAATCEAEGVHQAICTECDFNGTLAIPALGHHYAVKYYVHHEGCDGTCEETCQGQYVLECIFCGSEKVVEVEEIKYSISTAGVTIGSSKTSGKGTATLDSGVGLANAYARITWGYTDKNGDTISFCVTNPVDAKTGSFKMNGPSAPVGYTLTNVFVMITDNEDADGLALSDTPNYGYSSVK